MPSIDGKTATNAANDHKAINCGNESYGPVCNLNGHKVGTISCSAFKAFLKKVGQEATHDKKTIHQKLWKKGGMRRQAYPARRRYRQKTLPRSYWTNRRQCTNPPGAPSSEPPVTNGL
ncbi:hypothetical protein JTB14_002364 [Gonioctena quinquepunctata]|nr:hypothetical protein JTB14_002364 [Gonioctena quinquepunctata]